MAQWLIQTLVVALITIITTILTTKWMAVGYIISPTAKSKFRPKAKKYGGLALIVFVLTWDIFWLVYNVTDQGPLNRGVVVALALYVCAAFSAFLMLIVYIAVLLAFKDRKDSN
jgi:hypothetical protein